MAINPIAFARAVNEQFLRYEFTAIPIAEEAKEKRLVRGTRCSSTASGTHWRWSNCGRRFWRRRRDERGPLEAADWANCLDALPSFSDIALDYSAITAKT